jgi:hypothetical protein
VEARDDRTALADAVWDVHDADQRPVHGDVEGHADGVVGAGVGDHEDLGPVSVPPGQDLGVGLERRAEPVLLVVGRDDEGDVESNYRGLARPMALIVVGARGGRRLLGYEPGRNGPSERGRDVGARQVGRTASLIGSVRDWDTHGHPRTRCAPSEAMAETKGLVELPSDGGGSTD